MTSRYEYAKMDSFEIEQTTKLDLRYEYLTVKQRHEQARRRTTPDDNDENKIASDIKDNNNLNTIRADSVRNPESRCGPASTTQPNVSFGIIVNGGVSSSGPKLR